MPRVNLLARFMRPWHTSGEANPDAPAVRPATSPTEPSEAGGSRLQALRRPQSLRRTAGLAPEAINSQEVPWLAIGKKASKMPYLSMEGRCMGSVWIRSVTLLTDEIERYGHLEIAVAVEASFTNPYDPKEVQLHAAFTAPDGRVIKVPAFWYVPHKRNAPPAGDAVPLPEAPGFRIRFTPDQVGEWRVVTVLQTPDGAATSEDKRIVVGPAERKGFLRLPKVGGRGFRFDDGTPFYGIGANYGWWRTSPADYDRWLPTLAEHGVNLIRVWMAPWSMAIEWSDTGLGNYDARQARAAQLDYVLDLAERHGIYVMLVLLNHGQFSLRVNPEWDYNPYNVSNGGPLQYPDDFFVDETAKELFKQRLRYIVARWGHHTSLLAWELWNEVDLTTGYHRDAVAAWHAEMARCLRSLDPYRHPITTSFSSPQQDPTVWQLPEIDFTTTHFYDPPDIVTAVLDYDRGKRAAFGKPTLIGEFGVEYPKFQADTNGVVLHNGLWAGLFSLGSATPMSWWWDNYIEPGFLYPRFRSLARFLDETVGAHQLLEPVAVRVAADGEQETALRAFGIRGDGDTVLWVHDGRHTFEGVVSGYAPRPIEGASVALDDVAPGAYEALWWDTWQGEVLCTETVHLAPGQPLTVPRFSRDIAVRLRRLV